MKKNKILAFVSITAIGAFALTGCNSESDKATRAVYEKAKDLKPYIPENDVELRNYTKAQELYDNPAAIQWCTLFPPSNSAPLVTFPVAGKLTTSSTSYFEAGSQSVDGLFHGDSFYRFGFTPGDQYADVSNSMPMYCTTALTDFQRQNTFVESVGASGDASKIDIDSRQTEAEKAIKDGDFEKAENILEGGN